MARCCGSTGSCVCKVNGGGQVRVTGTGTSQDPFVIEGLTTLTTQGNEQFDLVIVGDGTPETPWVVTAQYATTASLDGLPDVDTTARTNGQVLAWDDASGTWKPAPPTTAAAGGVLTGNSVEGDGSAATPLDVTVDPAAYLEVRTTGLGLSDVAINELVRFYADAASRDADPVPLQAGAVSMLSTNLGQLDYWTGVQWLPLDNGIHLAIQPGEMLALSGPYAGGAVDHYVAQITAVTTDLNGDFEVIPAADLVDSAGVLSVQIQEMGTTPYKATVWVDAVNGVIMGRAFRLDDGTAYVGLTVEAVVTATLY